MSEACRANAGFTGSVLADREMTGTLCFWNPGFLPGSIPPTPHFVRDQATRLCRVRREILHVESRRNSLVAIGLRDGSRLSRQGAEPDANLVDGSRRERPALLPRMERMLRCDSRSTRQFGS